MEEFLETRVVADFVINWIHIQIWIPVRFWFFKSALKPTDTLFVVAEEDLIASHYDCWTLSSAFHSTVQFVGNDPPQTRAVE